MGNRANVIFVDKSGKSISPCVYLHWNGGAESIYPFLDELDRRSVRADQNYECARFISIVADFMNFNCLTSLSLGVINGPKKINSTELKKLHTDSGDNGIYVVCRQGDRKVRRFKGAYSKVDGEYIIMKEISVEDVELERVEAYKHKYNVGEDTIANMFLEMQGEKTIEVNA